MWLIFLANFLKCALGSVPFVYMGLPISTFRLCARDFLPPVRKVGNRVTPWRGHYNSTAGRVFLTNACVSSLPMLLICFNRLPEGTHVGFDKHSGGIIGVLLITRKGIGLSGVSCVGLKTLGA